MKQRKPSPEMYTSKEERLKEPTLVFKPCLVCQKAITDGYWGRWGDGGVCSKKCNEVMEIKPKENGIDHKL